MDGQPTPRKAPGTSAIALTLTTLIPVQIFGDAELEVGRNF